MPAIERMQHGEGSVRDLRRNHTIISIFQNRIKSINSERRTCARLSEEAHEGVVEIPAGKIITSVV